MPKRLRVTRGPLEAIHQVPDEIAFDVDTALDCIGHGNQMGFDAVAPLFVFEQYCRASSSQPVRNNA
jgi:hypothetical protein